MEPIEKPAEKVAMQRALFRIGRSVGWMEGVETLEVSGLGRFLGPRIALPGPDQRERLALGDEAKWAVQLCLEDPELYMLPDKREALEAWAYGGTSAAG